MPLEQTDMNVGFNSGADKVNFRRQALFRRTKADTGERGQPKTI